MIIVRTYRWHKHDKSTEQKNRPTANYIVDSNSTSSELTVNYSKSNHVTAIGHFAVNHGIYTLH